MNAEQHVQRPYAARATRAPGGARRRRRAGARRWTASVRGRSRRRRHRGAVPGDGPVQAVGQRGRRLEAQQLLRPPHVQAAAGLAVGFVVSQTISPVKPVARRSSPARSRMVISCRADVDRLGAVVALAASSNALGRVLDVQEFARRRAVAPEHDRVAAPRILRISAGMTWSVSGRSCRPGRRGSPAAGRSHYAVLLAVRLRATSSIFWPGRRARSSPPGSRSRDRLRGTDRREFRVGADRAERRRTWRPRCARLSSTVRAHHRVLIEETAGAGAVGADAPTTAARWKMTSGRASLQQPGRMSASAGQVAFQLGPGPPCARSRAPRRRSTRCEPRKPPPPVTTIRTGALG